MARNWLRILGIWASVDLPFIHRLSFEGCTLLAILYWFWSSNFLTNKMDAIKKKMAHLRDTLAEAERKADLAEKDLADAKGRADNVSPCFNCSGLCFVLHLNLLQRLATM